MCRPRLGRLFKNYGSARWTLPYYYTFAEPESVGALGLDEFAVETSDIAEGNALGTFGCACACVGTVAEAEFIHFGNHSACATLAFYLALRQECELAYLG